MESIAVSAKVFEAIHCAFSDNEGTLLHRRKFTSQLVDEIFRNVSYRRDIHLLSLLRLKQTNSPVEVDLSLISFVRCSIWCNCDLRNSIGKLSEKSSFFALKFKVIYVRELNECHMNVFSRVFPMKMD